MARRQIGAAESIAADAATKGYVDGKVWDGSDITTGTVAAARLPVSTGSVPGTMSAADKAILDAATNQPTSGTLVKRNGIYIDVAAPVNGVHPTTKTYVDAGLALKFDVADNAAQIIAEPASTDLPATYPLGLSITQSAAGAGWPGSLVTIYTIRQAGSRTVQTAAQKTTGRIWTRTETDGPAWMAWAESASVAYVDAKVWDAADTTTGVFLPARIPVGTGAAAGSMSAADKTKLDASTSSATNSTVMMRDSAGRSNVQSIGVSLAPTNTNDATRKDYVDTQVATRALTSHTHLLSDVTITALGASQDLDTYLTTGLFHQQSNTNATLVLNYPEASAGLFEVYTASGATVFCYQRYTVYASGGADFYWRAKYAANAFTAWQRAANDNPATGSVDGLMIAADKAKLDAATGNATASTLALRYSDGRLGVASPTGSSDAATKGYVDAMVWDGADITTGTVAAARLPVSTGSVPGTMSAADKAKLDAATTAATASTLVLRNSLGVIAVGTPTGVGDATTKAYVDGKVWDGADITTGTVAAARLPVSTGSVPGTMSAADKAKLDAATSAPTVSTVAMRNSAGRIQVTDPGTDTTAATPKSYVDAKTWDAADITTGTVAAARLPVSTGSVPGTMSAADKTKLDAATDTMVVGALAKRNASDGGIQFFRVISTDTGTPSASHLIRKDWLDATIAPLPTGLVGYVLDTTLSALRNTTDVSLGEYTANVVNGHNYIISMGMDWYGLSNPNLGLTLSFRQGGTTGVTGTLIAARTVWAGPVTAVGTWSTASVRFKATTTGTLRFSASSVRMNGAGDYKVAVNELMVMDAGSAI